MYIGLISDTHGVFSAEFKEFLKDVDEIWHAGDFGGGLDTEVEIAAFKPLKGQPLLVCLSSDRYVQQLKLKFGSERSCFQWISTVCRA